MPRSLTQLAGYGPAALRPACRLPCSPAHRQHTCTNAPWPCAISTPPQATNRPPVSQKRSMAKLHLPTVDFALGRTLACAATPACLYARSVLALSRHSTGLPAATAAAVADTWLGSRHARTCKQQGEMFPQATSRTLRADMCRSRARSLRDVFRCHWDPGRLQDGRV